MIRGSIILLLFSSVCFAETQNSESIEVVNCSGQRNSAECEIELTKSFLPFFGVELAENFVEDDFNGATKFAESLGLEIGLSTRW